MRITAAHILLAVLSIQFMVPSKAAEPERHALVIANSGYSVSPLKNPLADAALIEEALTEVGFKVDVVANLTRGGMYEAVNQFTNSLPTGATALVYYAGHGMQISGKNYLLPVDILPTSESGVMTRSFAFSHLTEKLHQSKAATSIVVLDACRNNPFKNQQPSARRSFEGLGLARIVTPRGMILAYSTAPGQLAEDGLGRPNSFFSASLAREIRRQGLTIEQVLKNVADTVRRETFDDQQPWFESSLVSEFYFTPPPGTVIAAAIPHGRDARESYAARSANVVNQEPWFNGLNQSEWDILDTEITRRASRVTQDEVPELEWKASNGNLVAQTVLGVVHLQGFYDGQSEEEYPSRFQQSSVRSLRGRPNNTEALRWLNMAANADFPPAMVVLGELYYEGKSVAVDKEKAAYLMRNSAQHDYKRAQINLKQMEFEIIGSPENLINLIRELGNP